MELHIRRKLPEEHTIFLVRTTLPVSLSVLRVGFIHSICRYTQAADADVRRKVFVQGSARRSLVRGRHPDSVACVMPIRKHVTMEAINNVLYRQDFAGRLCERYYHPRAPDPVTKLRWNDDHFAGDPLFPTSPRHDQDAMDCGLQFKILPWDDPASRPYI